MEAKITPRNVMAVVVEVDAMLRAKAKDMNLNQVEVILGLQELVGRIIVDMSTNQVGADSLINHMKQHLDDTVRIGMRTKGQPIAQA
jgi:hypothetical protein